MKSLISTFLFVFFCVQLLLAQEVQEFSFSREIKGVEFESASIMKYVLQPDKVTIYLELGRTGAVQSKMGPVWSGGADPTEIKALGILELSKSLELQQEELVFIKPDGIIAKQYKLLKEPGKVISGDKNVMATQDDCMSIGDIVGKYPELVEEEEGAAVPLPREYYDNSIDYGGLAMKVKGFNSRMYRLKPEGAKRSLFAQLTNEQYDEIKSTYDWDPYRGGDKKNYWMQRSASVCDPQTGMVYAHNGLMRVGEDRGRSMEMIQEVVAYDKSGKEVNRTEISFDVPHDVELRQLFYTDTPDNLYTIDGIVHVYRQNYGFGYKKLNPDPDPLFRRLYFWDAQGKEVANADFAVPAEDTRLIQAFANGNKLSLLAGDSKGGAWHTYHFAGGRLSGPENAGALAGGIAFTPVELASFSWEPVKKITRPDGAQTMIYHLKKEVKEADKTYTPSQGYLIFNVGPEGKIARVQHLQRSDNALPISKTGIRVYPGEGYFTLITSDPIQGDKGNMLEVNILKVNANTLEKTPVHSMVAAGESLSVERLSGPNDIIIFTTSPDGETYKLARLSL